MTNQTRRTIIKTIGATCASFSLPAQLFAGPRKTSKPVRLGVIADLHGGLAVDAQSRLDAFLDAMADQHCDALIQLGDFAYPNEKHQSYADQFNAAHANPIHVVGNHEFDFGLTRADCQKSWGIGSAYYARDLDDMRVMVLDGNEKGSSVHKGGYPSYVGKTQKNWLAAELKAAQKPVVILSHQPLAGHAAIDNATDIQELLSKFKDKIVLCINGHTHVDSYLQVEGVSYLHINSASYHWVGGKTRMAYYKDPLFTTITIDPVKLVVSVKAKTSTWKGDSPAAIGYFSRDNAPPKTIVTPAIRGREITVQGK